ncbi:MAG: alkaline phosphatase D family protein [Actinomycetota bacterium]
MDVVSDRLRERLVGWLKLLALVQAVLAIGFSVFGRRLGLLEFQPGGSTFDSAVRPILLVVFVLGAVVALRWELVGGAVAVFAAAGIAAFAVNQLIAPHAALTVAAFAVPGLLWVVVDVIELDRRFAAVGVVVSVALLAGGYLAGRYGYDRVWGPTHPASAAPVLEPSPTEWVWAGATTASSFEVRAKIAEPFLEVRLAVSTSPHFDEVRWFTGEPVLGTRVASFEAAGLEPGTSHHYAVEVDGELDRVRSGRVETFPEGPASFTVAFGACARVGSNGAVFDAINDLDPLLYGIVGDFHYGDNDVDELRRYHDVLDLTLTRPGQAALYRSTSIAYVWDDHDFGANDATGASTARSAAMAAYRQYVPSYELAGPFTAVHQAFTVGRVRFVMTDARAARAGKEVLDGPSKSMLGPEQKAWLKRELVEASADHELVVWINPVPWVAEAAPGADHWGGFAAERRELADHIAGHEIDNLLMVSGDAHMVAIDDGTNTDYATGGGASFPLLHVAALDRPGGIKGGPYSEGAIGDGGQFGTVEVLDDGATMEVVLTAFDWQGEQLLRHRFTVPS